MKTYSKHIIKLFVGIWLLMVTSCVSEENVFSDEDQMDIVSSTSLVVILQNFANDSLSETDRCFRFQFPLCLGYNNTSTIRIESYEGLMEVLNSQEDNFNITGLQFPMEIQLKETDQILELYNEEALESLIEDCEFSSIRDQFDNFFNKCFGLVYPLTLFDSNNDRVIIENESQFENFYANQGNDYNINFDFPIELLLGSNFDRSIKITTYFQFMRITNDCEDLSSCEGDVDLILRNVDAQDLMIDVVAFESSLGEDVQYQWFIDDVDQQINEEEIVVIFDGLGQEKTVCAKLSSNECPEGVEFCEVFTLPEYCQDDMIIEVTTPIASNNPNYLFIAENTVNASLRWFVNDVEIPNEDSIDETVFNQILPPGLNTICVQNNIPTCPEVVTKCVEVEAEEFCPEFIFGSNEIEVLDLGNGLTRFSASVESFGFELAYIWELNGAIIDEGISIDGDIVLETEEPLENENLIQLVIDPIITCPAGVTFERSFTL